MFQNIVIIGNCQAGVLADLISHRANQSFGTKVTSIDSSAPFSGASKALLQQADAVVEQIFNVTQPGTLSGLEVKAKIVRFPYVSGHFLWPNAGRPHPLQRLERPGDVFAGAEFGDTKLVEIIGSEGNREEQLESYINDDLVKSTMLARRYEMYLGMQHDRDVAAGFSVASLIDHRFRHERLFKTPGHPSMRLFQPVVEHVLSELEFPQTFTSAVANSPMEAGFANYELPIHPSVAAHFQLDYGHAGETYLVGTGERMTFAEHSRHYVLLTHNRDLAKAIGTFRHHHKIPDEKVKDAIEVLERACASSSGSTIASEILSRLYIRLNDGLRAQMWAHQTVKLAPESPGAWLHYGRISSRYGMFLEAEEALRSAIQMRPLSALLWNELSIMHERKGQIEKALQLVKHAHTLDEWDPSIKRRMERMRQIAASATTV